MEVADFLGTVVNGTCERFQKSRSILSFSEYLSLVAKNPRVHLRSSAQYFVDMIDRFGSYEVPCPHKNLTRYRVFDAEFVEGEGKIFGHELVQDALVRYIRNFVRSGRNDKLILLHGPNGSAKTSIVAALARALELYSELEDGAAYQFSWVFPKKPNLSKGLGFSHNEAQAPKTYATLSADDIDSQLGCEDRDHPLFLLPLQDRRTFFMNINQAAHPEEPFAIARTLLTGELSCKNSQIFHALLVAYSGDLEQVYRHIRVERFYFSKRYRRGLSVVEPQMSVDALARQMTIDQSIAALPASLRYSSLFEMVGPLVEANRGLIEYSDLLKRPLESWKYLLVACEQSQVSVGSISLFLDLLMIATSNELHLSSFKEYPDWPSFKGRIELIRVPYLLNSEDETGIYLNQIPKALRGVHIAPHAIEMAAKWAVLTRLEPPSVSQYPAELQEIIRDLSPDEKLALYERAEVPIRLSQKQARELKAQVPAIRQEYANDPHYEGRNGASPREILSILLLAAQDVRFDHLSVGAVFKQIECLIEQKSSYEFLRREVLRGYRCASNLLKLVKEDYVAILEDEVRNALGVYKKESHIELFGRYILHVSAWIKKETLLDPLLGKNIGADENFMKSIEEKLLATNESSVDFRNQAISQIAAFRLENPHIDIDLKAIFSSHLRRLKDSVYKEQRKGIAKIIDIFLKKSENDVSGWDPKEIHLAVKLEEDLVAMGYNPESARFAMAFLQSYKLEERDNQAFQRNLNFG